MTEQEREIETIKERNFTLKLSDADVKRLWNKAGEGGITAPELLEQFIGDLVHGTYSNGSDERMHANEWFERCWFGMFPDKTLVRYLIENWQLDEALELLENISDSKEELEYANNGNGDYEADEIELIKEDLKSWEEEISEIFNDFTKWANDEKIGTQEEEFEKLVKWNELRVSM